MECGSSVPVHLPVLGDRPMPGIACAFIAVKVGFVTSDIDGLFYSSMVPVCLLGLIVGNETLLVYVRGSCDIKNGVP